MSACRQPCLHCGGCRCGNHLPLCGCVPAPPVEPGERERIDDVLYAAAHYNDKPHRLYSAVARLAEGDEDAKVIRQNMDAAYSRFAPSSGERRAMAGLLDALVSDAGPDDHFVLLAVGNAKCAAQLLAAPSPSPDAREVPEDHCRECKSPVQDGHHPECSRAPDAREVLRRELGQPAWRRKELAKESYTDDLHLGHYFNSPFAAYAQGWLAAERHLAAALNGGNEDAR